MNSAGDFLSKFGGGEAEEATPTSTVLSAGAPNALGAFMDQFSTMIDSYWFYDHTEELRYDKDAHVYFRVNPELGNLEELHGVTTVLRIIDRSAALVPWGAKMVVEKLLRLIPLKGVDEFNSPLLAPMTIEDFTKIAMEAKTAPKDKLEDAGDIGHKAHECLEHSIQYVLDHDPEKIVRELRDIPEDEKAKACAEAGLAWMQAHNVRWLKTEQKIYSREYGYAGTMDGKAIVDSCTDPSCCTEKFKDSLSIIDWKSSNSLHPEYILQAAGAYHHAEHEEYGETFQNCFILRLGKNEEEAGKFQPWRIPAKDFPRAFKGFLLCLQLVELIDEVKAWISTQAKGVRDIKKQQRVEAKEIAKMKAKVDKAAAKAKLKLDRAEERSRIKADAKAAREVAKNVKLQISHQTPEVAVATEVTQVVQGMSDSILGDTVGSVGVPTGYEEALVARKTFVIPEES